MNKSVNVSEIDALLPQTQCGLCGYGGCMPYAKAIAEEGEAINRCPPGGTRVLNKLATLLNQPVIPLREAEKIKQVAFIREDECIGCMKCVKACPVDAIVGAAKLMHTVIADACTGCELCIPPCPVDCIDMLPVSTALNDEEFYQQATQARQAFYRHNTRLEKEAVEKNKLLLLNEKNKKINDRKAFIAQALERAKGKKT